MIPHLLHVSHDLDLKSVGVLGNNDQRKAPIHFEFRSKMENLLHFCFVPQP